MLDDRPVRREILTAGLRGLFTVPQLRDGQLSTAPEAPGLYTVWRIDEAPPRFAKLSTAGKHKGQDPTIPPDELMAAWVPGAQLLYVAQSANVRTRLRVFVDFASGKAVSHWEGRQLWQLADADELLIAWGTRENPGEARKEMLARFEDEFGRPPFGHAF